MPCFRPRRLLHRDAAAGSNTSGACWPSAPSVGLTTRGHGSGASQAPPPPPNNHVQKVGGCEFVPCMQQHTLPTADIAGPRTCHMVAGSDRVHRTRACTHDEEASHGLHRGRIDSYDALETGPHASGEA